jgi:hypothetical protein
LKGRTILQGTRGRRLKFPQLIEFIRIFGSLGIEARRALRDLEPESRHDRRSYWQPIGGGRHDLYAGALALDPDIGVCRRGYGPAMAQACTRQGVDVSCDDGGAESSRATPSSGPTARDRGWPRRIPASSSATNRPSSSAPAYSPARAREGHGADGKSERARQGALPDPGWRVVLFLRAIAKAQQATPLKPSW